MATDQSLDGVAQVTRIVGAMKEFSHPGTKEKSHIDINSALESTATVCANEWKGVADLQLDLDPKLPLVSGFPGELNQVFLNLIVNATHAIRDGGGMGKISVSTRKDGNWVNIRIADTGCGIPEGDLDKIFNPFFTTKDVGKGTGQGLSIVQNIVVKKHDGTISVDSKVGAGTTFDIRLPIESARVVDAVQIV